MCPAIIFVGSGYGVGALEVSVLAVVRAILSRMVPQEKRGEHTLLLSKIVLF